jgi:hypothetical protein
MNDNLGRNSRAGLIEEFRGLIEAEAHFLHDKAPVPKTLPGLRFAGQLRRN